MGQNQGLATLGSKLFRVRVRNLYSKIANNKKEPMTNKSTVSSFMKQIYKY